MFVALNYFALLSSTHKNFCANLTTTPFLSIANIQDKSLYSKELLSVKSFLKWIKMRLLSFWEDYSLAWTFFRDRGDPRDVRIYAYNFWNLCYYPIFGFLILEYTWLIIIFCSVQFSSVTQLCPTLRPHESQHACPSPVPGVYLNSYPSSQWCHPAISSSVVPFSSCPQSLPASGSFQMSQLFASGGQSIRVSASTSVLPMNTQDWSPLVWTGWISLQSKGLSRVFSNTTVQKHQFSGAQLSSQSNSHIHTWPLEKP